ncbi:HAD family phosphatase [Candidatus Saccharibacteria bacterium]|nr:HAD family phosphatase [Candidatus Saccharibacteria bacterium]
MSNKFAVFDIDGTIFRSGLYREVVYELIATDKAPPDLSEAFSQLEVDWKTRKHDDAFKIYELAMGETFSTVLPQIKCDDFDKAALAVFERVSDYVYTYTRNLVQSLKRQGYTLIAISGSQEELVKPFADKYGFDIWVGQHYERGDNGYFTGRTIKTHDGKDIILQRIVKERGLSFTDSIAVGDSRGDIGMLSIVEQPIAFNPDRDLFDVAKSNGWKVVVERKNMIYELEPNGHTFVLA